jgi:AraC family transcriptional regulator
MARWRSPERAQVPALPSDDPELMRMWELLNAHVGSSDGLAETLRRELPNYDSLRHRFTRVFRSSPRQVLMTLRMRRAKSMLLEGDQPIAGIAERLGYARQHEFTRAFHREVGRSPTAWRASGGDAFVRWNAEAAVPERRHRAPGRLKTGRRAR